MHIETQSLGAWLDIDEDSILTAKQHLVLRFRKKLRFSLTMLKKNSVYVVINWPINTHHKSISL